MVATTSRQLYAFARDNALPFSPQLAKVSSNQVPQNAILVTFAITSLPSLINLGSETAFNCIISLLTCSLLTAYMVCIGCILWRRVTNASLLPCSFSLGRYGLAVNAIATIFVVIFFGAGVLPRVSEPDGGNHELEHCNLLGRDSVLTGLLLPLWQACVRRPRGVCEEVGVEHPQLDVSTVQAREQLFQKVNPAPPLHTYLGT